jgi:hypothetical protein
MLGPSFLPEGFLKGNDELTVVLHIEKIMKEAIIIVLEPAIIMVLESFMIPSFQTHALPLGKMRSYDVSYKSHRDTMQ